MDGSPPGSPVPEILQARTLEWVAIFFSNAWKWKVKVKSLVSDSSNPMDCSPPGSSVHGIFQARVLEWGAIAFSVAYHCLKIIHIHIQSPSLRYSFFLEREIENHSSVLAWRISGTGEPGGLPSMGSQSRTQLKRLSSSSSSSSSSSWWSSG